MATSLPGENLLNTLVVQDSDTTGSFATSYTVPAGRYARVWIKLINFNSNAAAEVRFRQGGDEFLNIIDTSGGGNQFNYAQFDLSTSAGYIDIGGAFDPIMLNSTDTIEINHVTDSYFFVMEFSNV